MFETIITHIGSTHLPSGISSNEVAHLIAWVRKFFSSDVPEGYVDFLKIHNGFIHRGHHVFCILNDEIEQKFTNLIRCDFFYNNKQFAQGTERPDSLLLGKSDLEYITYHVSNKQFEILTNDILDVVGIYSTFEQALLRFLSLD